MATSCDGGSRPDATAPVETRLGRLSVRVVGSGPPAVLWHSLFVDSSTWHRVVDRLAGARRLLVVDGPGHGRSAPVRRRFHLQDCADAAVEVLEALGVDGPVDWVGNAWGGHVGATFAASHPERCRSLATIGSPVQALTAAERRPLALALRAYQLLGPRVVAGRLAAVLLGPDAAPEDVGVVTRAFSRADRRGMAAAIRWMALGRPDLTPLLPSLAAPGLLVASRVDDGWPPDAAREAAGLIASGAARTVDASGHVGPLLQDADAVVALLLAFWADPQGVVAEDGA